jgi:hypothetical protein
LASWGVIGLMVCLIIFFFNRLERTERGQSEIFVTLASTGVRASMEDGLQLMWSDASDTGWQRIQMAAARGSTQNLWGEFISPRVPPFLCQVPGEAASPASLRAMAREWEAIRVQRGQGLIDLEAERRFLQSIEDFRQDVSLPSTSFLRNYNLAVAAHLTGPPSEAARFASELPQIYSQFMPSLGPGDAQTWLARNGISQNDVRKAVLGRYLLGLIQLGRDNANEEAVSRFRQAINGFNFLTQRQSVVSHAQRIELSGVQDWACDVTAWSGPRTLTSVDAYHGLVAAYLLSPGFENDSGAMRSREFNRVRTEMEGLDPLAPFVLFGQRGLETPSAGPVPENVLWAASNLQRLRRFNSASEAPWLEPLSAILALETLGHPDWVRGLQQVGGSDRCTTAARFLEDIDWRRQILLTSSTAMEGRGVLAALVTYLAGAHQEACGQSFPMTPAERSALLQLATPYSFDAYSGILEQRRRRLTSAPNAWQQMDAMWDSLAFEQRQFGRGIVPDHLPAATDPQTALALGKQWQAVIFEDLVRSASRALLNATSFDLEDVELLRSIIDAAILSGLRPMSLVPLSDLAGALGPANSATRFMVQSRYFFHSMPTLVKITVLVALFLLVWLLGWIPFLLWRVRILSSRIYAEERRYRADAMTTRRGMRGSGAASGRSRA